MSYLKNIKVYKNSHLKLTGTDKNGKTQYIYDPLFVSITTDEKYNRIIKFSKIYESFIKKLTSRIEKITSFSKDSYADIIIYIMTLCYFRIGNEQTNTYGLTTILKKHVSLSGSDIITFDFIGKKGVRNYKSIKNKHLCRIMALRLKELKPTEQIFPVYSQEVNERLKYYTGNEFTCKDIRTYSANMVFILELCNGSTIKDAYEKVSKELCNTKYIAKKSYVMNKIEKLYKSHPSRFKSITNKYKLVSEIIK